MSFDQALQVVERNGGKIEGDQVLISCQQPVPVKLEKAFGGLYPVDRIGVNKRVADVGNVGFEGTGIVFKGHEQSNNNEYVARVEMYIDGELVETANLPASYITRRHELFWKYQLPKKPHTVSFKWLNPQPDASVNFGEAIVYSDTPLKINHQ